MQIHCPICDYTREVNLEKIPPTAEFATCPKCRHRFRFRALDLDEVEKPAPPTPNPEHADVWDAVDSLQDRWKDRDEDASHDASDDAHGGEEAESPHIARGGFASSAENVAIPWENPRYLGYLKSFVSTTAWVLFHPANFFSTLTKRPALLPALLYYMIFGIGQYLLTLLWFPMVLDMARDAIIERAGEEAFTRLAGGGFDIAAHLPQLLIMPFSLAIQLFLSAAIVHLLIRIMAPRESDFVLTMKVAAYASASSVLVLVPVAGLVLGSVGYFILMLIGCRSAFNLAWGQSLMTVIPLYILAFLLTSLQFTTVM